MGLVRFGFDGSESLKKPRNGVDIALNPLCFRAMLEPGFHSASVEALPRGAGDEKVVAGRNRDSVDFFPYAKLSRAMADAFRPVYLYGFVKFSVVSSSSDMMTGVKLWQCSIFAFLAGFFPRRRHVLKG